MVVGEKMRFLRSRTFFAILEEKEKTLFKNLFDAVCFEEPIEEEVEGDEYLNFDEVLDFLNIRK